MEVRFNFVEAERTTGSVCTVATSGDENINFPKRPVFVCATLHYETANMTVSRSDRELRAKKPSCNSMVDEEDMSNISVSGSELIPGLTKVRKTITNHFF